MWADRPVSPGFGGEAVDDQTNNKHEAVCDKRREWVSLQKEERKREREREGQKHEALGSTGTRRPKGIYLMHATEKGDSVSEW